MNKEPLIRFIQQNIQNISISPEAIHTIADHFEEIEFGKNDFFLKEDKISGYLYLVEGFMRAFTFDKEGNEVTTYFYAKNSVVFEVLSFFVQIPSSENIQALTHCKGYYANFQKINMLFHGFPEFREFGRLMLVKEFVAYKQRTLAMINKSAEERYLDLMNANKDVFLYAPLKHIASYLGITDTSLSRIRREFSKKEY